VGGEGEREGRRNKKIAYQKFGRKRYQNWKEDNSKCMSLREDIVGLDN